MRRTAISVDDCVYSIGPNSPATDAIIQPWQTNDFRMNNDPTTQSTLAGWYCSVNGTPGTWVPVYYGANKDGYYVVTQSTNAPTNAVNLGALSTGLVKITVSAGVATISVDTSTYLTTITAGTGISVSGSTVANTGVLSVTATTPIISSGGQNPNITHATSGVTATSYTYASFTVDAFGHITAASNGTAPVTSVSAGTGISISGTTTVTVTNTGVIAITAGTNITTSGSGTITVNAVPSGSNTYVQFNDSGAFGAVSGFEINKTTRTLTLFEPTNTGSVQLKIGYDTANHYDIGREVGAGKLKFYGTQSGFNGYIFDSVDGTRMTINSTGTIDINNLSAGGMVKASVTTGRLVIGVGDGTDYITNIAAGTGISISGTTTKTITNTGVLSLTAGTNITVSNSSGVWTINATGVGGGTVTAVTATSPISSSGGTAPNITHDTSGVTAATYTYATVQVNNTGHIISASSGTAPVTSVSAGTGISVSGTTTVTVTNTGVIAITAGTNITTSGSGTVTVNAVPTGSNTQVQYNNSGVFGAHSDFTYTSSTRLLTLFDATNTNDYQLRVGIDASYHYQIGRHVSDGYFKIYGTQSGNTGYILDSVNGRRMLIDSSGIMTVDNLAGTGNQPVMASSTGVLSRGNRTEFLLELGGVFTPITSFNGNPHWIGTGVGDIAVAYPIRYLIDTNSYGFGTLDWKFYTNKNTLNGDFEVHIVVNGTDLGAACTVTAGATGSVYGSYTVSITNNSTIEMKLMDSATGSDVTSGTLDIRATFWGKE